MPGARRATDNLRQMLAGDDDSLVLHLPTRRANGEPPDDPTPRWLTSGAQRAFDAGMPPDYDRIFRRMQAFERDRRARDDVVLPAASDDPAERTWREADALAAGR